MRQRIRYTYNYQPRTLPLLKMSRFVDHSNKKVSLRFEDALKSLPKVLRQSYTSNGCKTNPRRGNISAGNRSELTF
jgi:hypothetical protein